MDEETNPTLENQGVDIAISAMKSALGILPIVGPLMCELVGYTIPNQRFDRLVKFSTQLEKKMEEIDNSVLKLALQNENFTDLMEESLRQAASSLSDERREYIASIISNSLTSDDIEFIESKHILRILGEINDIEVIWLRFYLSNLLNGDNEFRQKHEKIITPQKAYIGASQNTLNKSTLQKSYKEHLVQIGLLKHIYKTKKFDDNTEFAVLERGSQKLDYYEITSLGKMVLRQINL